ncbi:molybdate ABC transporter substrate-binding protein [Apibacter muscae]|uniref:molybdate ABC transporter substrate-binding protein n=1 Tax=Apibacter muscae TaxID=2509004 RepID=UPI0011ADB520|nr:molybdate ABC transporter substrate-binding protein [Apibacter muscae]TWP23780.1 molybdate ABC transporter substrate-binding protein [Apibacter muscae]
MKIKIILFISAILTIISCSPKEQKVTIAAAANLRYVLDEIKEQYTKENPEVQLQMIYGSSGTLTQQILNGAPYNLFLSADTKFPESIVKKGMAEGLPINYCYGRLAMWSSSIEVSKGLSILTSPQVKKIAVANPSQAPYGETAVNLLKKFNLYNQIENKIVWGENINQTAQFASSGNAEVGFIALSLALAPQMKEKGQYYVLPENQALPIAQAAVLIKGQENNKQAQTFLNYIVSPKCSSLWEKYGYGLAIKKQ